MQLKVEISPELPDEVIIRSASITDEVRRLTAAFENALGRADIALTLGDSDFFLSLEGLLFFETDSGKVTAHTADCMYYSKQKLYELERILPHSFVRVSKSCIVNSAKVESVSRGLTGTAIAHFCGTRKLAYISRMYYQTLKDIIFETRIAK